MTKLLYFKLLPILLLFFCYHVVCSIFLFLGETKARTHNQGPWFRHELPYFTTRSMGYLVLQRDLVWWFSETTIKKKKVQEGKTKF